MTNLNGTDKGKRLNRPARMAHAAKRWATAVMAIISSPSDFRNLTEWGHAIGAARGTLRGWCRSAHVGGRESLDFARMLRAVVLAQNCSWDLQNLLDVVDDRTLSRLLDRGHIRKLKRKTNYLTPAEFVRSQRFICDETALATILEMLSKHPLATTPNSRNRRIDVA